MQLYLIKKNLQLRRWLCGSFNPGLRPWLLLFNPYGIFLAGIKSKNKKAYPLIETKQLFG